MSIALQHLTDAGRSMLGRANNGEQLNISMIVIGAGAATAPTDLYPLTALIDHRYDVPIIAKIDQGNGLLIIDGTINSSSMPPGGGFPLREVGVMAEIAGETPQLYCVANAFAETPDNIPGPEQPAAVHAFKIKAQIDRATNVTITLGTSQDILGQNYGPDSIGPGVFDQKIGNTLWYRRLVEGIGIELTEEAETITIGQKTLKLDLDLYVPENHPDAPSPNVVFPTIDAAIDFLRQYTIPSDRLATIHVAGGVYNLTATIELNHPNAQQIRMTGADQQSVNISFIAPGIGPNIIDVTVDSVVGLTIGHPIYLFGSNADSNMQNVHKGGHTISGIAGNIVSVQLSIASIFTAFPAEAITNARLYWNPTVLRSTANPTIDLSNGIRDLENFSIQIQVANLDGIVIAGNSRLTSILVSDGRYGFLLVGGNISGGMCAAFGNNSGFIIGGSAALASHGHFFANGNVLRGYWASEGSVSIGEINAEIYAQGNGEVGILADQNSSVGLQNVRAHLNAVGGSASARGFLRFGSVPTLAVMFSSNTRFDLQAIAAATIIGFLNGGQANTLDPPNDTVGNQNSYISVGGVAEFETLPVSLPV